MNKYWLANQGPDERLWSHEWNKHGTCISTLETKCYPEEAEDEPSHRYVLDYFNTTMTLFSGLDTYAFLLNAGIVPCTQRTYTLQHLQSVLEKAHGAPVTLRCRGSEVNEVWYPFAVRGSVQSGQFVPTAPKGPRSNCPQTGIRYLPKNSTPRPTTSWSSTSTTTPTPTTIPFTGKGHLKIQVLNSSSPSTTGCLISTGHWYTSGRCATFRVQDDFVSSRTHYFTLTSRQGPCSVNEIGAFECSRSLPFQTIFSASPPAGPDTGGRKLAFRNATTFYAAAVPAKFGKVEVFADDGGEEDPRAVKLEIVWAGP